MRTRGGIALAAVLAILVGPACGSSPTAPPPPSACSYQVTAGSNTFGAGGGSTTVTISTGSSCTWSVAVNEVWVTVGTPASGTGPGSVTVNVAPNTTTSTRQCAVTVGGQSIALTQEGQPVACEFTLEPSFERFDALGGKDTFEVRTEPACAWMAVSSAPWLEVISGGSGTGPGEVGYEVAAWAGGQDERTATIQVGPAVFTLEQEPPVPAACDYSVTPVEFAPCMPATTLTAALTTQQGCSWTAEPDASWITLTSGDSGSGSGVITFRVTDNYDAPRQSVVKVRWPTASAGQNLRVQQAGCLYAVSTESINVSATGGPGSFNVYQFSSPNTCGGPLQDACIWTAQSGVDWITITTPMPQQGDDPVAFTVAPNTGTTSRTGTITIRDKTVRITQAGL